MSLLASIRVALAGAGARARRKSGGHTVARLTPGAMDVEDGLVPESTIARVRALSRYDVLAATMADRARWFVAFLILGGITLFAALGWYTADQRFANGVRVAWVKLDPSGAYTVDFADDVRPVEFFQATLESKIAEFVDKRYRRVAATILADYRYVGMFLSPKLQVQFMGADDINAPRVAAELVSCKGGCVERDVRVRVIQHRNQTALRIPERRDSTLYESLAFATFTDRKPDGSVAGRRNVIVQLGWRIKGRNEITANKSALIANPLGLEIVALDLKEDPTPVQRD